jgi:hypothetical protein
MSTAKGQFPELARFLGQLRGDIKKFDIRAIHDLLYGRQDRSFVKKAKSKLEHLNRVVEEIRGLCKTLDHPADGLHIRSVLWTEICANPKLDWDAELIGKFIVSELEAPELVKLMCILLPGSASPRRKVPHMYPLSKNVWLLEPTINDEKSRRSDELIRKLGELLPNLPDEVVADVRAIEDPFHSTFGGLFVHPMVAYRTNSRISERGYCLRRFGIPMIALHTMVVANELNASDDISFMSYVRPGLAKGGALWGSSSCPEKFLNEWNTLSDGKDRKDGAWPVYSKTEHDFEPVILGPPREGDWSNMGLSESCSFVFSSLPWFRMAGYEIDVEMTRINCFHAFKEFPNQPSHFLILPSLIPLTNKLIEAGNRVDDPTADQLFRRIGHGVSMWERAFRCAREEEWETGWWLEADVRPVVRDPDAFILYSTVVLEALFSSPTDKQEVTTRISDFTAGLLGNSAKERYDLAKELKKAYSKRCDFVHGNIDREEDYTRKAIWLFKIATCALWKCIELTVVEDRFKNWDQFIEFVQRRKFGEE